MRSMHRRLFRVTAAAAGLAVLATAAPPVAAVVDTEPPTLTMPAYAQFVVGTQISDTGSGVDPFNNYFPGTTLQQQITWNAVDAGSGVCGYDLLEVPAGAEPYLVVDNLLQRKYVQTTTDYDDQEGGGSFKILGWQVVAHDCAGNSSSDFTIARPVVTQEDGWTYGYSGVSLTYVGTWGVSHCSCWSADQTRKTAAAGAAVAISRSWASGEPIGLVMERAPDRGQVRIYVDGVLKATVDTYSATKVHRSVVWAARMKAGVHVVRLVNVGTAGRPRIDLDAVLNG